MQFLCPDSLFRLNWWEGDKMFMMAKAVWITSSRFYRFIPQFTDSLGDDLCTHFVGVYAILGVTQLDGV